MDDFDLHPLVFMLLLMNLIGILLCGICSTYKNFKVPAPCDIRAIKTRNGLDKSKTKRHSNTSQLASTSGFVPKRTKNLHEPSVGSLSIGSMHQTRLVPIKKTSTDQTSTDTEQLLLRLRKLHSDASLLKREGSSILKVAKEEKPPPETHNYISPDKESPKNLSPHKKTSVTSERKSLNGKASISSFKKPPTPELIPHVHRSSTPESKLWPYPELNGTSPPHTSTGPLDPNQTSAPYSTSTGPLPDPNQTSAPYSTSAGPLTETSQISARYNRPSGQLTETSQISARYNRPSGQLPETSQISARYNIPSGQSPETSRTSRIQVRPDRSQHTAGSNQSSFSLPSNAFMSISSEGSRLSEELPTALNLLHQLEPFITKPTCPPRRSVDPLSNNYRRYSFHGFRVKTETQPKIFRERTPESKPEIIERKPEVLDTPEIQLFTIVEEEKAKKTYERPKESSVTSFVVRRVSSNRLSGLGPPQSEEQFFKKLSEPVLEIPSNSRLAGLAESSNVVHKRLSNGSIGSNGSNGKNRPVKSLPTIIELKQERQRRSRSGSPVTQPPLFIIKEDRSLSVASKPSDEIEPTEEGEDLEVIKEDDDDEIIKFTSRTLIRPPEVLPEKSEGTGPLRIETRQRKYSGYEKDSPDKCCCKLFPKDKIQEFTNISVFRRGSRSTQDQARYICEVIKPIPSLMRSQPVNQAPATAEPVISTLPVAVTEDNKSKPKEDELPHGFKAKK